MEKDYKAIEYSKFVNLSEIADDLFEKCHNVLVAKNKDYSGATDSLRNFKVSAEVSGVTMSQGILTRLMDKMLRVGNLIKNEAVVKDESIYDTLMDAINYCVILYAALQEERNGEN